MDARVAALEQIARNTVGTLARLEQRFEVVDERFKGIDQRFQTMDQRFQAIDLRFDAVDKRFGALERRLDLLISEHHADFRWLIALILGQTATLLAVMAHGFHWL
jgi:hypothetical protein